MEKRTDKLTTAKPKNLLTKPLTLDFRKFFVAMAKAAGQTYGQKWTDLPGSIAEALTAIGIYTTPGERASTLIQRGLTHALFNLLNDSSDLQRVDIAAAQDTFAEQFSFAIQVDEIIIDQAFFDRPGDIPPVQHTIPILKNWLVKSGIADAAARAIANRLPAYFGYALNREWREHGSEYEAILKNIETPFSDAADRDWDWEVYNALLDKQLDESIFDEPFGLRQIYIPLNAYYREEIEENRHENMEEASRPRFKNVVVCLEDELDTWLHKGSQNDALRVLSGGPGSGKSSFARIYAAKTAKERIYKVLFIPLHLMNPRKDLVESVGGFLREEGLLRRNPLDPDHRESTLLIIFDGLDELASQGKAAAETASEFVSEVERTLEYYNRQERRLRVLLSGRELVIQENQANFRRTRQVLTLLSYYHEIDAQKNPIPLFTGESNEDSQRLLAVDLRDLWWNRYGRLIGKRYEGLPKSLSREDLNEVTAQPLLNYLIAMSFVHGKLEFTDDLNLNKVYADLVVQVHQRGYERRVYKSTKHLTVDEFTSVLEEIALAAWHGDGRTTTVREIEAHCKASGAKLWENFEQGAKAGVTRLLAAFFFRQYGERNSGDKTFIFTHKSFGEYLAACRIVRAMEDIVEDLKLGEKSRVAEDAIAVQRLNAGAGFVAPARLQLIFEGS